MMEKRREEIKRLQEVTANIRNICILAHVDHGKTTLSDSLIASNGIISRRLAGKLRYMDNRDDEQLRGITMKSSAIALQHTQGEEKYLINLIDSPGHVDFSSEVSTAVRLCDGALIVVDVVEGVCPQTKVVLEQAWQEGIKPCLVLNKMDRLITHLKLTPLEAYNHIEHILQQVNVISATLWMTEVMQQNQDKLTKSETDNQINDPNQDPSEEVLYDWDSGVMDKDDSHVYFSPEAGNVVFTSAIDGWGFGIEHFVQIYTKKLGFKEDVLRKTLWGDYYINNKTKRICKGAQNKGKKPLFVQLVLENLWTVYDAVRTKKNKAMIDKITASLGLKISARDSSHSDPFVHLFAICSQWLPLAPAVLSMVVKYLPSPLQLSKERAVKLLTDGERRVESYPIATQELVYSFMSCQASVDSPKIVFVSKMFPVDLSSVHEARTRQLTVEEMKEKREAIIQSLQSSDNKTDLPNERVSNDESEDVREATPTDHTQFLAFSRIFSGRLHKGDTLYVLHPRYNPNSVRDLLAMPTTTPLPSHVSTATVNSLYVLMGRDVMEVESVSPGNIIGIAGLEGVVIKSASLSSTLSCTPFRPLNSVAFPIVHVAIEATHFSDIPSLDKGLSLLNQSDPCVKLTQTESGERILSTAGEVHLQRCLDDLRNTFARVDIKVSPPIVPFRETVIAPPTFDMVNEVISFENELIVGGEGGGDKGTPSSRWGPISVQTPGENPHILKLIARPLPEKVIEIIDSNSHLLKLLPLNGEKESSADLLQDLQSLYVTLQEALVSGDMGGASIDHIWAFGPRNYMTNILLNRVSDYQRLSLWEGMAPCKEGGGNMGGVLRHYDNSIINGFRLACQSGPLCDEPLRGVCLEVIDWTMPTNFDVGGARVDFHGSVSGQLISVVKEGCRQAMLAQPTRLMAAMYSCIIQAATGVLSFVYAVIGKRGGRVTSEEMIEGSDIFIIQALIPVAESFGFCDEFRKQTIGQANPQLVFSHWEVIPSDPFWVPSTEMELLHYGEKADSESVARGYMNAVRKRKGLQVEEKIVEHAEKQRTLKRNK